MPLFLDACALAKRYTMEGHSTQTMNEVLGRSGDWGGLIASHLIVTEVTSVLTKKIREAPTAHRPILRQRLAATVLRLRRDYHDYIDGFPLEPHILHRATALLRDNPEYEIGAADAIHLVTAAESREGTAAHPLVFVSTDRGLVEAASAEGFATFNPNWDTVEDLRKTFADLQRTSSS